MDSNTIHRPHKDVYVNGADHDFLGELHLAHGMKVKIPKTKEKAHVELFIRYCDENARMAMLTRVYLVTLAMLCGCGLYVTYLFSR